MNQEATFALKFTIKNLASMRKALEEINKKMADLGKKSRDTSKNLDKVDKGFGKATRSALKFAVAYFSVSKMITSVFSKANEAIQLQEMSIAAGVAADKIGVLGKTLKKYGGDARSAGAAYASLTNIIGGAQHGMGISEDVARVNAMFGIGFNYGNISQDALMTQIAKAMHRLKKNKDSWGIQQIASAYGLSNDVANFLSTHGANWKSQISAEKWEKMNLSDAQKAINSQERLADSIDNAVLKLTPLIQDTVDALTVLTDFLKPFFKGVSWLYDKYVNGPDQMGAWLAKKAAPLFKNTLDAEPYGYSKENAEWLRKNEEFLDNGNIRRMKNGITVSNYNGVYTVMGKDLETLYGGADKVAAVKAYWDAALRERNASQNITNEIIVTDRTNNGIMVKPRHPERTMNITSVR